VALIRDGDGRGEVYAYLSDDAETHPLTATPEGAAALSRCRDRFGALGPGYVEGGARAGPRPAAAAR
jgi:hypothetical protein